MSSEKSVTWSSDFLTLDEAEVEPKPVQKPHPPIWIAGGHFGAQPETQLKRIAKYGNGFMSTLIKPEEYRLIFDRIGDIAKGLGKNPSSIHRSLYVSININNDSREATREGNDFLTQYYGYPFWEDRWGPFGPPSEVIKSIDSFKKAGVETFVVRFAAKDQMQQLDLFTKEVYPSFS